MELKLDAAKYAWSRMEAAARLIGDATPTELAIWADTAQQLAEKLGVEAPYTELAGELIADGVPAGPARIAAVWAARRFFAVDPRIAAELDGPSDDDLAGERLAFEADREEAETRRFYREEFPGVAAARGQRVEDSRAWRTFAGAGPTVVVEFIAPAPFATVREMPLHEVPSSRQVDWPAERIRDEYRRFWATAERRVFDAEYKAALPHAADDLEAARFATRRVLDRRVEQGSRRQSPPPAAAGVSA